MGFQTQRVRSYGMARHWVGIRTGPDADDTTPFSPPTLTPLFLNVGVTEMPEPLMSGHKVFHAAAAADIGREGSPGQHQLQRAQQILSNLEIGEVARMMKCDEDLVR